MPARAAGIFVEGRNVWMIWIRSARLHQMRLRGAVAGAAAKAAATRRRPSACRARLLPCRVRADSAPSPTPHARRQFGPDGAAARMIAPCRPQGAGIPRPCLWYIGSVAKTRFGGQAWPNCGRHRRISWRDRRGGAAGGAGRRPDAIIPIIQAPLQPSIHGRFLYTKRRVVRHSSYIQACRTAFTPYANP